MSSFTETGEGATAGLVQRGLECRCVFLTAPRLDLYGRIDQRCDEIVAAGLVEEAAGLRRLGPAASAGAIRAVGYRQALEYLEREWFTTDTRSPQRRVRALGRLSELYKGATRQLARKQLSWYRNREPRFWWLMRTEDDDDARVAEWIVERDAQLEPGAWAEPPPALVAERAAADRAEVERLELGSYRSAEGLFADPDAAEAKVADIHAALDALFPGQLDELEPEDAGIDIPLPDEPSTRGARRSRRRARDDARWLAGQSAHT